MCIESSFKTLCNVFLWQVIDIQLYFVPVLAPWIFIKILLLYSFSWSPRFLFELLPHSVYLGNSAHLKIWPVPFGSNFILITNFKCSFFLLVKQRNSGVNILVDSNIILEEKGRGSDHFDCNIIFGVTTRFGIKRQTFF